MSSLDRVLAALVAYVGVAAVAGGRQGPTVCPYRLLARRPCPVCGLTRSLGRTTRLDLAGARAHHRAGPAVLVVVLGATVVRMIVGDFLTPSVSVDARLTTARPRRSRC